jgi:GntR family transcriptional regulator
MLSLGLSPNMPVVRLKRLRTADESVVAIETSTIPAIHIPDPQAVGDSLYDYFDGRGIHPVRALQHIRAVNASAAQARLTSLPPNAAMLHITRVSYLASGAAVELTHSYFRSDYYGYVTESHR